MGKRYIRTEERIGLAIKRTRESVRDVQRPTGTEKARTKEVAAQAALDSDYAKGLAEELQIALDAAQGELAQALADSAQALADAGLAKTEAAQAVADAAEAAEAASQAVQEALAASAMAAGAVTFDNRAPLAGDAAGKPDGAVWYQLDSTGVVAMWELQGLGWITRPLTETIIPKIQIGSGTYGDLNGNRLVARSILADRLQALSITANELAANSITSIKIAADAVTADKIIAGAVTTIKLNALAVTAEKLAVGSVVADKIATGAIIAGKIAATAIDGMTITGAIIRTAPDGQRIQLDVNGLRGFKADGTQVFNLQADGYGVNFNLAGTGTCRIYGQATGGRLEIDGTPGPLQGRIEAVAYAGSARFAAFSGTQHISIEASGESTRANLRVTNGSDFYIENFDGTTTLNAALIRLYGTIQHQSDVVWTQAQPSGSPSYTAGLRNGWTNNVNVNWNGLQTARYLGVTYVTGAVTKASAYASLEVIASLPQYLRPAVPTMIAAHYAAGATATIMYVLVRANGDIVTATSGPGGQIAITGSLLPGN